MNTVIHHVNHPVLSAPCDMTELVRGTDERFVALFAPVVRERSITVDLGRIERIDAAGIAALISLYGAAGRAGHNFHVCNVCAHVCEILALVGLDHILVSHEPVERNVAQTLPAGAQFAQHAA
jgi:anti-anti-sigma regulatory factor